ncbi:hypothetical protein EYF80_032560 [Liparis tanakae]|uniref:Uncharacterized protein n=1 Tax=Liparis tanakae TaxID=230148 RepID=A0A4Z2GUN2_9TELE|nr:hypothetical protein EYF80_032560 [Liparis tanakae]
MFSNCFDKRADSLTQKERERVRPAEGLGGGRVVQGGAAGLVRLVDLGPGAHQGHSALVPPISSRVVQRLSSYLLVDVCPVVDQQLQTEGPVGGDGGQVQGGVAALVGLVHISSVVHQLGRHRLLPHVARHMERRVPKAIGLIDLTAEQTDTRSDSRGGGRVETS